MWDEIRKKGLEVAHKKAFRNLTILFSFIFAILVLYLFYPNSFLVTWKGRMFYLFFLWLTCLELALSWEKLSLISSNELKWSRTLSAVAFMVIPTIYALVFFYTELNQLVIGLGGFLGVPFGGIYGSSFLQEAWPLSFEYMLFAACFTISVLLTFSKEGLKKLSIALSFLWAVAFFYMADTFFPFGKVWILQAFVPITANSSAGLLNLMGYKTITMDLSNSLYGPGTLLTVFGSQSVFSALVFWPSAGVHSMFIYTLAIILFIKGAAMSVKRKALVYVIGALGTFVANVLRITTISIIGVKIGWAAAEHFHDYYGEFFFIFWIIIYLATIVFGQRLLQKIWRTKTPHVTFLLIRLNV